MPKSAKVTGERALGNRMLAKSFAIALFSLATGMAAEVKAQTFEPFSQQGAEFTASMMAMLWLGLEQGVVERCGGDVSVNGQKLMQFFDLASRVHGQGFADAGAGMFGEGLVLGQQMGCNVDKLRTYGGWAELYYGPVISRLTDR